MQSYEAGITSGASVSFGPFRLHPTARVLEKHGRPLALGDRALDILIVLVERTGEIVTHRELLSRVRKIREEFPAARFIVLTTYTGDVQALDALKAGASAYLLKSMLRTELLETIRLVHMGKRRIPAEIATEIAEHAADDALSERELEVLRAVGAGYSNKQIANRPGGMLDV